MIGYYVHHQGRGHLSRLEAVAAHLRTPVVGLSSLPKPAGWQGDWVQLARDDDPSPASSDDVSALGVLHWAPRHHQGLSARMATLASWVARERPAAVVVDVSVEVALLVRLCGTPVVVVALPGERTDRTHLAAYDLADALLAPWPAEAHARGWPASWTSKTWCVGGLSRFDGRARPPAPSRGRERPRRVLLLWGGGGRDADASSVEAARRATPGWTGPSAARTAPRPTCGRSCARPTSWSPTPGRTLSPTSRRPAPPPSSSPSAAPFGEQVATAAALSRLGHRRRPHLVAVR